MSCHQVSNAAINVLADAAYGLSFYHQGFRHVVDSPSAQKRLGQELAEENAASYNHRYSGQNVEAIEFDFDVIMPSTKPIDVIAAIAYYEYQTCEHPAWPESKAAAFCEALRARAINKLPGMEEAKAKAWQR